MNQNAQHYLKLSFSRLSRWLPMEEEKMMEWYKTHPKDYVLESDTNGFQYCLFAFPLSIHAEKYDFATVDSGMERLVLLVYENDMIVADCSAVHAKMSVFNKEEIIDWIAEESDWTYLSHYILTNYEFPAPSVSLPFEKEGLMIQNAYVSLRIRKRLVFTKMMRMLKEMTLRDMQDNTIFQAVISLDPDIPCYGEDTRDEPYYYSMEQDEPKRMLNREILTKLKWNPIRLEEDHPEENTDGTKLWFALYQEQNFII